MALIRRNVAETLITSANDDTFAEASKGYRCWSGSIAWLVGWSPNRDLSQMCGEHRLVMVLWVCGEFGGRLVKFYNILRLHVYILSVELDNLRWVRESLRSWVVLTLTNCWFAFGQYNKRTSNRRIRDTCMTYTGVCYR